MNTLSIPNSFRTKLPIYQKAVDSSKDKEQEHQPVSKYGLYFHLKKLLNTIVHQSNHATKICEIINPITKPNVKLYSGEHYGIYVYFMKHKFQLFYHVDILYDQDTELKYILDRNYKSSDWIMCQQYSELIYLLIDKCIYHNTRSKYHLFKERLKLT